MRIVPDRARDTIRDGDVGIADVRVETAHAPGLVLLSVECGDLKIAAVMSAAKADTIAQDIAAQAASARSLITSN